MLQRLNEKKEGEDDEAYHLQKLEEIKKKKSVDNTMPAFIVHEKYAENEFGGVEVWSTDFEDEEVRWPTHGNSFVVKEESSLLGGRCLMVTSDASQMRGYTTDSGYGVDNGHGDDSYFDA